MIYGEDVLRNKKTVYVLCSVTQTLSDGNIFNLEQQAIPSVIVTPLLSTIEYLVIAYNAFLRSLCIT